MKINEIIDRKINTFISCVLINFFIFLQGIFEYL